MAKRDKAIYQGFERFESAKKTGTFVRLTDNMLKSAAWANLTLRQQGLYLYCKAKYKHQKPVGGVIVEADIKNFIIARDEILRLYGSPSTFAKDRDALIENGFIVCVENGRTSWTPNVYAFTDGWHKIEAKTKRTKSE